MILFEQRRDFGEKINATFSFLTENFARLGLALVCIVGPFALLGGIVSGYGQAAIFRSGFKPPKAPDELLSFYSDMFSNMLSPYVLIGYVFALFGAVLAGLVTYSYMNIYRRGTGRPIEVGEVWNEVQPFIGQGVLLSIATTLILGVGLAFFIIPGIYVFVVLSLSTAVLVFEQGGASNAISRSFRLITNNWWATCGLIVVMYIINMLAGSIFGMPAAILGGLFGAGVIKSISGPLLAATTAFSTVGSTLLSAIPLVALAFQYFNLVDKNEGTGLDRAISGIGQNPNRVADDLPASIRKPTDEQGDY
jgi:hypothetical protein